MRGSSKALFQDSIWTGAGARAGLQRFSIYACINCLNRSSIGVRGGTRASLVEGGIEPGAEDTSASGAGVALGSANRGAGDFG